MQTIRVLPPGAVEFLGKQYKAALGKNGITNDKREGDWATPIGCFPLREVFYRADRIDQPKTSLPVRPLNETDGWCDDSADTNYNKLVPLPYPASHETLWRDDHVYDIIVVVGYNDAPPVHGKGSAIFMHLARESYSPTAGCVALAREDLLDILKHTDTETRFCVVEE